MMQNDYKFKQDYFPYPKSLMDDMYKTRIYGIPFSFFLLDYRKTQTHCLEMSLLLKSILKKSDIISGNASIISGNDKFHAWLEEDGYALDPVTGLIWEKSSYYKMMGITETEKIEPELDFLAGLQEKNSDEMYLAFILDIKSNYDDLGSYKNVLFEQVKTFQEEKKLDISKCNKELLKEYLGSLIDLYKETMSFIEKSK